MKKIKINENTIFTTRPGKFLAWNLDTGEQFEIFEKRYLDRVYELATHQSNTVESQAEDHDLVEAGLVKTSEEDLALPEKRWGWDDIAKIFHLGSKHNFPSDLSTPDENPEEGYVEFCEGIAHSMPKLETERKGKSVSLPQPSLNSISINFSEVLIKRKTSRHFNNNPTSVEKISDLMYATFGKIHGDSHRDDLERRGVKTVGYRRSSPSAGCLQSTEAYLFALNVTDLPKGIYHYAPQNHSLTLVNEKIEDLNKSLCHQTFASDASFLIIMTCRFDKLWWKYPHSRAYRSALLEVGHISQTYNLVATALGLNTWVTGYFIDDMLNNMLGIDGLKEHSIFVAAGGPGFSDPLSPNMKKLL